MPDKVSILKEFLEFVKSEQWKWDYKNYARYDEALTIRREIEALFHLFPFNLSSAADKLTILLSSRYKELSISEPSSSRIAELLVLIDKWSLMIEDFCKVEQEQSLKLLEAESFTLMEI